MFNSQTLMILNCVKNKNIKDLSINLIFKPFYIYDYNDKITKFFLSLYKYKLFN